VGCPSTSVAGSRRQKPKPTRAAARNRLEPACRTGIIRRMETTIGRVLIVLLSVAATITAALTAGYTAFYELGLSPEQIRTRAINAAIIIGLLLAIAHYAKKLWKPK
jgi:hypothetical protein